jgi:hypothetical protein
MNAKGKVDWTNVEEVRARYAENREIAARTFGTIKVCFVFSMISSLIPAIFITLFGLSALSGQIAGLAYERFVYGDDTVADDVRKLINGIPGAIAYLSAIWPIGIVSLIAFLTDTRKPHKFLRVFYVFVAVISLVLIFIADYNAVNCMLVMAYGMLGAAVSDLVLRQYNIVDKLSKEPGFPKFLDHFDQTNTIQNTGSNYVNYHEKLKELHDKDKSVGAKIQKAIVKENITPEAFEPGIMPEVIPPDTYDDYERGKRSSAGNADHTDLLLED